MRNISADRWHAAYLFTGGIPFEDILRRCLRPFIDTILAQEAVAAFFFIRYWEGGPHIRFRFFCSETKAGIVLEKLEAYYLEYLKERRSEAAPASPLITYPDYEPETDRYGGKEGLALSEQHFMQSSLAVLTLLGGQAAWRYDDKTGLGLQLNFLFVCALDNIGVPIHAFADFALQGMLPYATGKLAGKAVHYTDDLAADCISRFTRLTEQVSPVLFPRLKQLKACVDEAAFDALHPALADWYTANTDLLGRLRHLHQQGKLDSGDLHMHKPLYGVYTSLLHMTNNRTGIRNEDESYLLFVVMAFFKGQQQDTITFIN